MLDNKYDWQPYFGELAKKLLEQKFKQREFGQWLDENILTTPQGEYWNPISIIQLFLSKNKDILRVDKQKLAELLKERLEIEAAVPKTLNVLEQVRSKTYIYSDAQLSKNAHGAIWPFFEELMLNEQPTQSMFRVFETKHIASDVFSACFVIKPEVYIPTTERTRYLDKDRLLPLIKESKNSNPSYEEYLAYRDDVNLAMKGWPENDYSEIVMQSLNHWNHDSESKKKENSINSKLEKMNSYDEYITLLKENRNLVLTGAPGTGKTFLAKKIAEEMGAVTEFVQFHPSYDYTDFVEGLRPVKMNGQVGFERKDGVFKAFCKKALLYESANDDNTLEGINDNPTIWKVSLDGAGDNPTRRECMVNNCIRIGWRDYGDVDDFNDFTAFDYGGKSILRAFQSQMQIGDVVVSCYGEYIVDAIGIITGDYEYRDDSPVTDFPRYRSVKWIIKDVRISTKELFKKRMTLSTVYKLDISLQTIINIVKDTVKNSTKVPLQLKPHVFIIDEINRGDISKIFGELFFAIDPGYRGTKGLIKTQYQNMVDENDIFVDNFYVPENVYILATMNDIDRSVESMDFAMRRRFAWKEITPESRKEMLECLGVNKDKAINKMDSLNTVIKSPEGLGAAFQIGPAYFLKLKDGNFNLLWEMNIEPLLREYLRGIRKAEELMRKFKHAYIGETEDANTQESTGQQE